ncbi:zinc finger protein 37-like [Bacillus rossius redtenbacheri]|uniref:zinc finger protein 37-like n=1 Tax=Bacillus rossius redtenbacheri TaxID=93214 RepID=UPI002FDCE565
MPQGCVVSNCTSRYGRQEKVSMYRFPLAKPKLVARWVRAIQKPAWEPTKNSRICMRHFEDHCFWTYNGKRALTPSAIPTKFDPSPCRVNGQRLAAARKPWYLPPVRPKDVESVTVTRDVVYIKTEPDLYLSENDVTIKDEPQSEGEQEVGEVDVSRVKVEETADGDTAQTAQASEQQPLPIVFPVVKTEVKEEPEDYTYSLPPSNFARLASLPVATAASAKPRLQARDTKELTAQRPPRRQRSRKRRRVVEDGILSDHTYVKFKMKVGCLENPFYRLKNPASVSKCSRPPVRPAGHLFVRSDLGVGQEPRKQLCNNNISIKKANGKNSPLSNSKRISKFPTVSFSNSKSKNGLVLNTKQGKYVLNAKQGKYSVCKKLSETFLNDINLKSLKTEGPAEDDFNKENTLLVDRCLNSVIGRISPKKSSHVHDKRQMSDANNDAPSMENVQDMYDEMMSEQKFVLGSKGILSEDKKFSGHMPLPSSAHEKIVASASRRQRKPNLTSRKYESCNGGNLGLRNKAGDVGDDSCSAGHVCLLCEEAFPCQLSLKTHVAGHCQKSAFACAHCAKTFVDAESLGTHSATHVLLKCVLCGAGLPSRSALCEHVLSHFGGAVLECAHCPRTFYGPELYGEHQLLHAAAGTPPSPRAPADRHERVPASEAGADKLRCAICDRLIGSEAEYKEHVLEHGSVTPDSAAGTRPVVRGKRVKCMLCGTKCASESSLKKHILVHTGEVWDSSQEWGR